MLIHVRIDSCLSEFEIADFVHDAIEVVREQRSCHAVFADLKFCRAYIQQIPNFAVIVVKLRCDLRHAFVDLKQKYFVEFYKFRIDDDLRMKVGVRSKSARRVESARRLSPVDTRSLTFKGNERRYA